MENPIGNPITNIQNQGSSADKTKEWQQEMLMEKLRSKAGQFKTFFESAKALRMALLEKRYPVDGVERGLLQKCLDTLQQNIKVTTLQSMVERLESVSRQLGLKFMAGPSGLDWFISSDMFYLEVVLDAEGNVKDVKIHHEGKVEQQSCEELVSCLTRRDFADFTAQLEGLASIYQLNAEKKVKCKAFSALTALEADLTALASLQSQLDPFSLVHKSAVGVLEKRRGGHAMKLTYFVPPYELLDPATRRLCPLVAEPGQLRDIGYSVTVCMEGSSAHRLQTATLVPVANSGKSSGAPLYSPLGPNNSATLPATFALRLNRPLPMCAALCRRVSAVTDGGECGDLNSRHPLLSLIVQHESAGRADCANNRGLFVNLPDQHHCYFMTESPSLDGVLVSSIPFTHPSHVPQILACLRQQALFNTVIASCIRPNTKQDVERMIMMEVTPLSWQHLSVSLEHPLEGSMATTEMDLTDVGAVRCKVYTAGGGAENGGGGMSGATTPPADHATTVLQMSLSIPVTMRALIRMWESQTQRMNNGYGNGGGLGGGSGGGGGGGGGGSGHTGSSDYDPDIKIKMEPGSGGALGRTGGGSFSDQSLQDPGFEPFSSPILSDPVGNACLDPVEFGSMMTDQKTSSLLNLLSSETKHSGGKKRKRKSADGLWRSPKRKQIALDECEIVLESSSNDSTPLGTPTSRDTLGDLRVSTPNSTTSGLEFSALSELESSGLGERSQSDLDGEEDAMEVMEVTDLEDVEEMLKASTVRKPPKKSRDGKKESPPSNILLNLESKNLVSPSVSITPITTSSLLTPPHNFNSVLTGMGLERRPGIEIIPIVSAPAATLPSSITITPISAKAMSESDRSRSERKSNKSSKSSDDRGRMEKKKKKKRDGSPMGPPDKFPLKQDPLTKPVSVSIKPSDSNSPRPSSPAGALRKYSTSPTHTSPLAIVGKLSPGGSGSAISKAMGKGPSHQSPKHSPAYSTSSPKNNQVTSSPKHGTLSPKHQSGSAGKPSMSALKSAVSSPSSTGSGKVTSDAGMKTKSSKDISSSSSSTGSRDKERSKSGISFGGSSTSGHQSPKLKTSSVKLKQLDLAGGGGDTPSGGSQSGGSTPPSASGDGGKSTQPQARNRKGSLSAVIDKLKSAQHCGDSGSDGNGGKSSGSAKEGRSSAVSSGKVAGQAVKASSVDVSKNPGEYMVKPSSDGMKITINKTRSKDTSSKLKSFGSSSSSGSGSPKTHTGLKPGVNSGPASKKSQASSAASSGSQKPNPSGSSKPSTVPGKVSSLSKSSSSGNLQSKLKSSGSPKTGSGSVDTASRGRDGKPRPKSSAGGEKSIFSPSKMDSKRLSPSTLKEESDYKLVAPVISPQLVVEGLMKQLDTKFQIPKLSARAGGGGANVISVDTENSKKMNEKSSLDSRGGTNSPKVVDLANKVDISVMLNKYPMGGSSSKNAEDGSRVSSSSVDSKANKMVAAVSSPLTIALGTLSPKLSSTGGKVSEPDSLITPNISIIPMPALGCADVDNDLDAVNMRGKPSSSVAVGLLSGKEDILSSLKMELPISTLSFVSCNELPLLQTGLANDLSIVNDESKRFSEAKQLHPKSNLVSKTTPQEAAEILLDFSTSLPNKSDVGKLISISERAISSSHPLRKNTPPPPPPAFPGSPSVSVHIVKSPAPSPLITPSPHSASPCITDDELMDEALVGMGK